MKVVYDTCLYIDFLRASRHLDIFQSQSHIRYLSPIVMMELNAGVRVAKQQTTLDKLYQPYSRAGRIVRLENEHYHLAGKILAKIRDPLAARRLSHDVLVALAAHAIGAWLFTSNRSDFQLIRKHLAFKLEVV